MKFPIGTCRANETPPADLLKIGIETEREQARSVADVRAGREAVANDRVAAIYRSIFDAIVDQRLPPGAKLPEEQLACHDLHALRIIAASGSSPRAWLPQFLSEPS